MKMRSGVGVALPVGHRKRRGTLPGEKEGEKGNIGHPDDVMIIILPLLVVHDRNRLLPLGLLPVNAIGIGVTMGIIGEKSDIVAIITMIVVIVVIHIHPHYHLTHPTHPPTHPLLLREDMDIALALRKENAASTHGNPATIILLPM